MAAFAAAMSALPMSAQSGGVGSSLASAGLSGESAPTSTSARVMVPNRDEQHVDLYEGPVRPFSSVALEAEAGTLGLGGEVATPLTRSFNLRAGAEFLSFNYNFTVDAAQYASNAHLRSAHLAVDFHPLGGGFRISPQLLMFESQFGASVFVPGANTFELGKSNYLSSATDPVHGSATITMGRHVMPALSVGWGNMLSRHSRHWSIPFEVGAAYTGHYTVDLNLSGTACLGYINCMSTSSEQVQQSVIQEEAELNETMKHFQIYPIVKTGFGYRF